MGAAVDPSLVTDEASEAFKVFALNWDSVTAFLACETQWRVIAGSSALIWTGFDYSSVDVVLRRFDFAPAIFADLQVMELAALAVFAGASA
ncbi:hypothetical protein ASE04_27470 [Rhizobium sp. Root708]|uniref:DUF1799 domain-containing protein n=1 Tax=Rhizobium sp. Root708 TaxID=1736592 RepID=UPI0006F3ACDB|nr:DUF1799 domain-containing protein [Rhizobium sp. Root708]KRB58456.1 hypothetical protein ASE04_27470 [Rhizobium sp. Root708]